MVRGALTIVLLSTVACSILDLDDGVLAAFTSERTRDHSLAHASSPRVVAESAGGSVRIQGEAFDPCANAWKLEAEASRIPFGIIRLNVHVPQGSVCWDLTVRHTYEAVLAPLSPGRYRILVRQKALVREPWSWPVTTVLDTMVQVS
jgi:hypothetical protein